MTGDSRIPRCLWWRAACTTWCMCCADRAIALCRAAAAPEAHDRALRPVDHRIMPCKPRQAQHHIELIVQFQDDKLVDEVLLLIREAYAYDTLLGPNNDTRC
ncbi:hypothetical protein PRIC1_000278 [Phytophthora ramorum]